MGSHLALTLDEVAYLKQIVGKLKPPIYDILYLCGMSMIARYALQIIRWISCHFVASALIPWPFVSSIIPCCLLIAPENCFNVRWKTNSTSSSNSSPLLVLLAPFRTVTISFLYAINLAIRLLQPLLTECTSQAFFHVVNVESSESARISLYCGEMASLHNTYR